MVSRDIPETLIALAASVENGGGFVGVSPFYFLITTLMIFSMHAVCLNLINKSQNRRRESSVSLRDPVSGSPRAGQPPNRVGRTAPAQSRGLSAEVVAALPRVVVQLDGAEEASTCTICFEPVVSNEQVFALSCGHRHHLQCLTGWLERKDECPDCRGRVTGGPTAAPVGGPLGRVLAGAGVGAAPVIAPGPSSSTREQLVATQAMQSGLSTRSALFGWADPALQTGHQDDDAATVGPAVVMTSNPVSGGARAGLGMAVTDDPDQEGDEL